MSETYLFVDPDGLSALAGQLNAPRQALSEATAGLHSTGALLTGGDTVIALAEFRVRLSEAVGAVDTEVTALRDAMVAAAADYTAADARAVAR